MTAPHVLVHVGLARTHVGSPDEAIDHDMERSAMTQPSASAMRDHPGAGRYEVRLRGHLESRWAAWFDGMTLSHERDGSTILSGEVVDQAALHGLLGKVRHTGLPLISVIAVEPDMPSGPGIQPSIGPTHSRQGD
jgi:hypothetical protein